MELSRTVMQERWDFEVPVAQLVSEVQVFIQPRCIESCRSAKQQIKDTIITNYNAGRLKGDPEVWTHAVTCNGKTLPLQPCQAREMPLGLLNTDTGQLGPNCFVIGEGKYRTTPEDAVTSALQAGAQQLGATEILKRLKR